MTCADQKQHVQGHRETEATSLSKNPEITITINPESRIRVVLGNKSPALTPCGIVTDLPVRIVNQGFVTASLEANLVGNAPVSVALDFPPKPLKGTPEELRNLLITLTEPGPTDLTIAFRFKHQIPNLGGRDRIHLLVNCE
jgi:hypothetical protein